MELLGQTYFFKDLDEQELVALKQITRTWDVPRDHVVLRQGQPSDELYIVQDGAMRVLLPIPEDVAPPENQAEQTLLTLGPGECFGEFAFVDRKPSSATVVAASDCTLYAIPHGELDVLLVANPMMAVKIYRSLLHIMVQRFRNTDIELAMRKAYGD